MEKPGQGKVASPGPRDGARSAQEDGLQKEEARCMIMGQQGKSYLLGSSRITQEWLQVTRKSRPCSCLGGKSPETPKSMEWKGRGPRLRQPALLAKSIEGVWCCWCVSPMGQVLQFLQTTPCPLRRAKLDVFPVLGNSTQTLVLSVTLEPGMERQGLLQAQPPCPAATRGLLLCIYFFLTT